MSNMIDRLASMTDEERRNLKRRTMALFQKAELKASHAFNPLRTKLNPQKKPAAKIIHLAEYLKGSRS